MIVRDETQGGVFNRDVLQTGGAVPGVRYQWGGVWFSRQRHGREWNLKHLDVNGDYGGDWGAAIKALIPYFSANDRLIAPEGDYLLKSGYMVLKGIPGFRFEGYGAKFAFDTTLAPTSANGGFYLANMIDFELRGFTIDGRLDARQEFGGDAGPNFISNINITEGCDGGLIEDVQSDRSMMDGFYNGHVGVYSQDIVVNDPTRWPRHITFNRIWADRNYRQGMSATASHDTTVYTPVLTNSGQIKGAAPMAGLDIESEDVAGWGNWRLRVIGGQVTGNKGRGISVDMGSDSCTISNVKATNNGLSGILVIAKTQDCKIDSCNVGMNGEVAADEGEIGALGTRTQVTNNTIVARPGSAAITGVAGERGHDRVIHGNNVTIGGPVDPNGKNGVIRIEGARDIVTNNTVVGGFVPGGVVGVIDVRSAGGIVANNVVVDLSGGNATWSPILIDAGTDSANIAVGYTNAICRQVSAKPDMPANTAPYSYVAQVAGADFNALVDEVRALKAAVKAGGVTK